MGDFAGYCNGAANATAGSFQFAGNQLANLWQQGTLYGQLQFGSPATPPLIESKAVAEPNGPRIGDNEAWLDQRIDEMRVKL